MRYGDDKTIHGTQYLDIEVHDGNVVGVWFRCMLLPFKATHVDRERALSLSSAVVDCNTHAKLNAVVVNE
jgi:hypothetical protein